MHWTRELIVGGSIHASPTLRINSVSCPCTSRETIASYIQTFPQHSSRSVEASCAPRVSRALLCYRSDTCPLPRAGASPKESHSVWTRASVWFRTMRKECSRPSNSGGGPRERRCLGFGTNCGVLKFWGKRCGDRWRLHAWSSLNILRWLCRPRQK